MRTRRATIKDLAEIQALYSKVAARPGGISRLSFEVTESYVQDFLTKAIENGVTLVVTNLSGRIVAEIHAYASGLYCFSHILSNLTIVVDPDMQGRGVGRLLFESFLALIENERKEIFRVELIARESNHRALRFYESLGFRIEGRLQGRIKNVDGSYEADIPMAWIRRRKKPRPRRRGGFGLKWTSSDIQHLS